MMPFAFDLISTFVIGSILPVATTDRAIVPRSTVACRDSGIVADPLKNEAPQATSTRTKMAIPPYRARLLVLFIDTQYQTEQNAKMLQAPALKNAARAYVGRVLPCGLTVNRYNAKLSPKVTNQAYV
jgi:hypothetical protein